MSRINTVLPTPLSDAEEAELYQNWNDESWKVLAERNMRLAAYFAGQWHETGVEFDELMALALLGIVKAARAFRPELGNKFSTYARRVVDNEIQMELRRRRRQKYMLSIEHPIVHERTGDVFTLADILPAAEEMEGVAGLVLLTELMEALPERQRMVIKLRNAGYSQIEIAAMWGCGQSGVSRTETAAKKKLRKALSL